MAAIALVTKSDDPLSAAFLNLGLHDALSPKLSMNP